MSNKADTCRMVHELDPDGKQLHVIKYSEYAADKVRTPYPGAITSPLIPP